MNEVGRRAHISSGRMSIIERGVAPTDAEAGRLTEVLVEASRKAWGEAEPTEPLSELEERYAFGDR